MTVLAEFLAAFSGYNRYCIAESFYILSIAFVQMEVAGLEPEDRTFGQRYPD